MRFRIKAVDRSQAITWAWVDARDRSEATRQAGERGYSVLAVQHWPFNRDFMRLRRQRFDLILFSQELLALLQAGLSVVEAIEALAQKQERSEMGAILRRVSTELYRGQSLSHAFEQLPDAFPELFVASVRASERTGDLIPALTRFVAYQSQVEAVRKKVINACIYPALLIAVGAFVVLFLMIYVVPRFSLIFDNMGADLPLSSRLLLEWGLLLRSNGVELVVVLLCVMVISIYALRQPSVRRRLTAQLCRIPVFGQKQHAYQLARLYRTLGMLLNSGTALPTSLKMVQGLLSPGLRSQLSAAETDVKQGHSISQALHAHGLTTPVALRMLRVGERSGNMGVMMQRIAGFYEEELARWVELATRLFEPALMVLIGLFVGMVVVLMYLPIFELAGSLG